MLHTPQGKQAIALTMLGAHNVQNAQAAATAALALNISLADIATGLAACAGAKGRLQRKAGWAGARVIDDTYNANPDSVRAAIAVLQAEQGQRILVLGDLGELGEHPVQQLAELGWLAQQAGINALYTVGALAAEASQSFGVGAYHFQNQADLIAGLRPMLNRETVVLVKGSRFMQMERVVMGVLANSDIESV
jgi:UDP-N-acetylmuramoyl-tripeptide--D-alanyl-D-alanine ligase